MTEPDNDRPLHELVRQRLADYHPPFDPENWQRMRQKIRRNRWRPVAWLLAGTVLVAGFVWYASTFRPASLNPHGPTRMAVEPDATKLVTKPIGLPREVGRKYTNSQPTPGSVSTKPVPLPAELNRGLLPLEPHWSLPIVRPPDLPPVIVHSPAESDIIRRVTTGAIGSDSTTYRVFSRNLMRWPNAVVVCDFTSSMYLYSTQLMAWFQKNQANKQVQGIVLFTDCDSLGRETRLGRPGQLFAARSRAVSVVLPLMLASARNTMGNVNDDENNIEALVYAQRQFPEASHLILIADNSSTVKDLDRLPEIHKPVHVILCGPTMDTTRAFQPDYYTIARQTGGSLHTLEDDLTDVAQLRPNTWIRVDDRYYRLNRRGQFVSTDFRHRPRRLLGFFWR